MMARTEASSHSEAAGALGTAAPAPAATAAGKAGHPRDPTPPTRRAAHSGSGSTSKHPPARSSSAAASYWVGLGCLRPHPRPLPSSPFSPRQPPRSKHKQDTSRIPPPPPPPPPVHPSKPTLLFACSQYHHRWHLAILLHKRENYRDQPLSKARTRPFFAVCTTSEACSRSSIIVIRPLEAHSHLPPCPPRRQTAGSRPSARATSLSSPIMSA